MNTPTIGLDMSLRTFTAAVWFGPKHALKATFANDRTGFRKLQRWLKVHCVGTHLRVGVESTNTYADAVVEWLYQAGYCVYLLNPERTACYARALGQRNKTDPADAVTIAAYVANHECTPWQPPPPEQKTLRELTRTRHQLSALATQVSNQLRTAKGAGRAALQAVLRELRQQIAGLVRQIGTHLRQYPHLAESVRHLMTVKGIGLITAATIVAELPPITAKTDPRTICGWAGLTPRRWQSGQTEWRSRLSRKGNAYLRNALYMPALVAKRFNPVFRAMATRLAAKGKTNGAILGAISHKMLRIAVGLLRSNSDFDPNWHYETN
jgi:transposase